MLHPPTLLMVAFLGGGCVYFCLFGVLWGQCVADILYLQIACNISFLNLLSSGVFCECGELNTQVVGKTIYKIKIIKIFR